MAKIGLFYGSTTGNTVKAAELIQKAFGPGVVDLCDVGAASAGDLEKYDTLILGTSTWHWGGLQDEWAVFEDSLTGEALRGKTVAFFGLGDQKRYADHFVDGMGLLHDKVKPLGAKVIGQCPRQDYSFDASAAEVGDHLVGLALDEDNEPHKTLDRVNRWVRRLKQELGDA
ncbi:MAG TPA: flavodoxin [Sedimentisphaerales bacterium]|jgi:flavodoxin long chain|nr:flavodoxin [Sedimentisphaerales bacterium]HNU29566.1 flavodoxin [Sedimentisphaerales bacterium]